MTRSAEDALSNLVGKRGTEAVMINFKLKERIDNPATFHQALILGFKEASANILERAIIKEIYRTLNRVYEPIIPFNFVKEYELVRTFVNGEAP
jgi:hypothetical protein